MLFFFFFAKSDSCGVFISSVLILTRTLLTFLTVDFRGKKKKSYEEFFGFESPQEDSEDQTWGASGTQVSLSRRRKPDSVQFTLCSLHMRSDWKSG